MRIAYNGVNFTMGKEKTLHELRARASYENTLSLALYATANKRGEHALAQLHASLSDDYTSRANALPTRIAEDRRSLESRRTLRDIPIPREE